MLNQDSQMRIPSVWNDMHGRPCHSTVIAQTRIGWYYTPSRTFERPTQDIVRGAHQRNGHLLCRASEKTPGKGFSAGFGGARSKQKSTPKKSCPCGSRKLYGECCEKYHKGVAIPPTAEALMRSRYSAYAKGLVDYIVDTTHPDNPLAQKDDGVSLRKDVIATCKKISWDKLVVLETEDVSENEAYVTFQTYFKVKGQQGQRSQGFHTQSFVEKSRFLLHHDDDDDSQAARWLYQDGEQDWEGNQWV